MKPALSLTLVFASLAIAHGAFAEDQYTYPILNKYAAQTQTLIDQTTAAKSEADVAQIINGTEDLVKMGEEVMNLYADKNPNCKAQYEVFLQEVPTMETKGLDEVHERYHNAVGLPAAPKHCYFGRSQIVHPVMNIIRLKSGFDTKIKADVLGDFDEVMEHLVRIQKNLDNPPN